MNEQITDTQRLDWLESKIDGGTWMCGNNSISHEFSLSNACSLGGLGSARQAIDFAMEQERKLKSDQVQPLIQDQDYEPS